MGSIDSYGYILSHDPYQPLLGLVVKKLRRLEVRSFYFLLFSLDLI